MRLILGLLVVLAVAPDAATQSKRLPLPGRVFTVAERTAFVIEPDAKVRRPGPMPWVWYAPTLKGLPSKAEVWMFSRFLAAGVAIAGIDVGESYGSPEGRAGYQALFEHLTGTRGYGKRPVLLARSRGGLMLYGWAAEHPEHVGGVAGIYPVCNLASYPGVDRAAKAYGMTPTQLRSKLQEHNPVDRLEQLAKARVQILHIHGDRDRTVPLGANSALLRKRYVALGGRMDVIVVKGKGHDMWRGWFESRRITEFVIDRALGRKSKPAGKKGGEQARPDDGAGGQRRSG